MLYNIIRVGKKDKQENGKMKYVSIPFFWKTMDKAEESLEFLLEHQRMVKQFENLKSEVEKELFLNEIKGKPWFFSSVADCENQSFLSGERMNMEEYKEAIKDLSVGKNQINWKNYLKMISDDGEYFISPVFWNNDKFDFHNAKLMRR